MRTKEFMMQSRIDMLHYFDVLGGYELPILILRGIERVQEVKRNDNSSGPMYTDYSIDLEQSQVT